MPLRVRLAWAEDNGAETGHRVYRSETPMDPGALPTPLATLGPNVTEYVDEAVVENSTYYYRVSAYTPFKEAISDEVSRAVSLVPDIGAYWAEQGGYYAGISSLNEYVIVAPASTEVVRQWKTGTTDTPGCLDTFPWTKNAKAYRDAMVAAGIAAHPAQNYCLSLGTNGFTDWCLPGPAEATLINNNLNANTTTAPLFQPGGSQQYRNATTHASASDWWYWTARQDSASTSRAVMHRPSSPSGLATWPVKTESRPIRAVRTIPI